MSAPLGKEAGTGGWSWMGDGGTIVEEPDEPVGDADSDRTPTQCVHFLSNDP